MNRNQNQNAKKYDVRKYEITKIYIYCREINIGLY